MSFMVVKVDTEQEAMDVVNAMVLATGRMVRGRFDNSKKRVNVVSLDRSSGIILYSVLHEDFDILFPYPFSASEYLNFIKENKDNPDYIQRMESMQIFNFK